MKKTLVGILLILIYTQITAQHVDTIVVKATAPVGDIFVYFKSLESNVRNSQQLVKVDMGGYCSIPYTGRVFIHISCAGFNSISDTLSGKINKIHNIYMLTPLNVHLNEIVTTGQYEAKPANQSVFNTTIITRAQIEQRGDNNVRDALMTQLNIRLNEDPILGTQIKMQGISGDNIKILIDGVPVIGRNDGNLDLSQINLNNIERIEITQGPMSVIYGTDALGGVINLITKKKYMHPVEGHFHFNTESIGTYNADGDIIFHNKNNNFYFNSGRNFFNGYPKDTGSQRSQLWKPRMQAFGGIAYNHIFNKVMVQLKSQYYNELIANLGDPTITPFYAYAFDAYYRTIRWDNSISAQYKMNNNCNLDILAAYNYYRKSTLMYRKDLVSLEKQLVGNSNQDTTTFDARLFRAVYSNINPAHRINYQTGIEINNESGYGSLITHGTQSINDEALFGSLEWTPTEHTLIRPALRISTNSDFGTSIGILNYLKFTPLLPSLNIKQDLKKNLTLRWGIARGYRAPALKELFLNFVDVNHDIHGNINLKAEKSTHSDVQLTWNKTVSSTYIKCEPMLFYNNIYNLITLVQTGSSTLSYKYFNTGRYITYGLTLPLYITFKNFNMGLGYSLTALFDSLSTSTSSAKPFTYTSEFTTTASYTYTPYKLAFNLYYKYTGRTPGYALDSKNNLTQTVIADYSILDASVTKYLYNKHLTITGGVKNLLNVTSVFSNAPVGPHAMGGSEMLSPGRALFIDLRIDLFKSHA